MNAMRQKLAPRSPARLAQKAGAALLLAVAAGGAASCGEGAQAKRPARDLAADEAALSPEERGKRIHTRMTCNTCHSLDGVKFVGPSFKGLWGTTVEFEDGTSTTRDEAYFRHSILEPEARKVKGFIGATQMPGYKGKLTDAEVDDLIALIKSCGP